MSNPAISLEKIQDQAPGLVSLAKTAGVSLEKKGLSGHRAAVYLVLDHSLSMDPHYKNGNVQRLAEQTLALATNLDDDGKVPLIYFGDTDYDPVTVDLADYEGIVGRTHRLVPWGCTDYASAIAAVCKLHLESDADAPALVVFQTDGNPYVRGRDAAKDAVSALKAASKLPLFFSFVGFGDDLRFLRKLDTLRVGIGGRKVDNASLFETGHNPLYVTDAELYDGIMHEYPSWLEAATKAGIVA